MVDSKDVKKAKSTRDRSEYVVKRKNSGTDTEPRPIFQHAAETDTAGIIPEKTVSA